MIIVSHYNRVDQDLIPELRSIWPTKLLETENKKETKTITVTKLTCKLIFRCNVNCLTGKPLLQLQKVKP